MFLALLIGELKFPRSVPKQNWEPKPWFWTSQFKFRLDLDLRLRAWDIERATQLVRT